MEGRIMSLEKAKKYLESKGCLDWKECATPRAGWMCAKVGRKSPFPDSFQLF